MRDVRVPFGVGSARVMHRRNAHAFRCMSMALTLWAAAASVSAQSTVRTEVDTTVITVGGRVTMTISVDHPATAQASLPDSIDVAPFEALAARTLPVETTDVGATSTFELTLTAFELGELEVPPVPVEVSAADGTVETLETDRFGVQVVSVGSDESGDIRGIRGPLAIPISSWIIALWLVVPLLVAALLYFLVRRLRPKGEEPRRPALGPVPRPAHEVALEALSALEASPLLERGQVKEYHIAASDILRTYVEERFRVEALEMTTREVLEGLAGVGADASFRVGLRTFLEACDLVKFAKGMPSIEESRAALELGRRIILESVPSSSETADGATPRPGSTSEPDATPAPASTAEPAAGAPAGAVGNVTSDSDREPD